MHATIGAPQPNSGNVHVPSSVCGLCLICFDCLNSCPHLPQSASLNVKVILNASKHWNNSPNVPNFKAESGFLRVMFRLKLLNKAPWSSWNCPDISSLSPAAAHFRQVCSRRSCWTFSGCHEFTNQQNARGWFRETSNVLSGMLVSLLTVHHMHGCAQKWAQGSEMQHGLERCCY